MAELLARHATPQTEAALLQVARGKTVQAMRIALAPQGSPDPADNDDEARTLSLTLPVEEAWALEATRMMVEHMDGKHTGAHFLESLLAEATIPLLDLTAPPQSDVTTEMEAEHTAWRAETQRLQHQQAEAELKSRPAVPTDPNPGEAPDARERLGMSRASLRNKLSLARRSQGLHQVADALQQGHIGFEAAHLLARIATPTTERAWLTRATRRTFKHLREEVQAVEMATRFAGATDHAPPSQEQIDQMQALERAILSGDLLRRVIRHHPPEHDGRAGKLEAGAPEPHDAVQISVTPKPEDEPPNDPVQISVGPSAKITLRIRVPGDILHHVKYRANGGTDAPNNLTSPCPFCHLEGEHAGRPKILPPGNNPTWLLGRHPIMKIQNRERTLLN